LNFLGSRGLISVVVFAVLISLLGQPCFVGCSAFDKATERLSRLLETARETLERRPLAAWRRAVTARGTADGA
jgi:hypothetical protein